MFEYVIIIAVQFQLIGHIPIFHYNDAKTDLPIIPVFVNNIFNDIGWITALALQLFFVIRGLPFMKPGTHYINCLLLKIKWWFILLCLLMTLSMITFSYAADTKNRVIIMIPLASLLVLKSKQLLDSEFLISFSCASLSNLSNNKIQRRWKRFSDDCRFHNYPYHFSLYQCMDLVPNNLCDFNSLLQHVSRLRKIFRRLFVLQVLYYRFERSLLLHNDCPTQQGCFCVHLC